jgi:glutamate dehydrogenase
VGAKGAFVPKMMPAGADRETIQREGTACYQIFVQTLLDVTDNLEGDVVLPPPDVRRRDGDDPYLVVAADKGTASFSDTANAIATARGFWLGDAFASGGSNGYDHKKMGITARGAWEAVKRHFRELDRDIQTAPFTVAGVGDMSGDVFGNGMLLSEEIRLVAAFDHRDIFIDPDPDPHVSFAERKRLFALSRSSWQDYDKALLSPGGDVYARSLKIVPLSPEARQRLGLGTDPVTAQEVMSAILKAEVDLLWFGGIGTYVRGTDETNAAAGDRANDALRITGRDIRAKVVGEGANLAVTQRGRIDYALAGGHIDTDAIDNSAGVNNWDLVDSCAPQIIGQYLLGEKDRSLLLKLAKSKNMWNQRMAVVANQSLIKAGQFDSILIIAEKLLNHPHDLIHKAVGWMLREVGDQDEDVLRAFLKKYASTMPRTMLRYAIEKFSPIDRTKFMKM